MEIPPLLLQTAGSALAILALASFAYWLRLGGAPLLEDAEDISRAAGEIEDGFIPAAAVSDAQRITALASDESGRVMVIKRHGNRFAGRILGAGAQARLWHDLGKTTLEVDCGETRFGKVILDIPDPDAWAEAINGLNEHQHV